MQVQVSNPWKTGENILDLYKVIGPLGSGSLGTVYQVHHPGWNLDLAVTVPHPIYLTTRDDLQKLEQSAATWGQLGYHPHLASCYYLRHLPEVKENGRPPRAATPLLFVEYGSGGSLKDWLQTGRLYRGGTKAALKRILDIAIQSARGLDYARQCGLIHQNFKPSNVLLTDEGITKVSDFARFLAPTLPLGQPLPKDQWQSTPTGAYTPAYRSPEQQQGDNLTHATDIWNWALVLLEMFQGQALWMTEESPHQALDRHLQAKSLAPHLPSVPKGVISLLQWCFQERPEQRPQSLLMLARELVQIYSSLFGTEYPYQELDWSPEEADSLNNQAVALLDLGQTKEAAQLWELAHQRQPDHPETIYNLGLWFWRSRKLTDDLLLTDLAKTLNNDDRWIDTYLKALIHLERENDEAAIKLLEKLPDEAPEEVRTTLALAKNRLSQSKRPAPLLSFNNPLLTRPQPKVNAVSFSPDSRYGVLGNQDGTLQIWHLKTQEIHVLAGHPDESIKTVAIAPNNRYVLSLSDHNLKIWSLISGKCLCTFPGYGQWDEPKPEQEVAPMRPNRHPKESALEAFLTANFRNSRAKKAQNLVNNPPPKKEELLTRSSEDGRYLLLKQPLTLTVKEVATGQILYTCWLNGEPLITTSQSSLGLTARENQPQLVDLTTGRDVRSFEGHSRPVKALSILPNGRYFLSGSADGTLKLWSIATGSCLRTFKGHRGSLQALSLSPDGRYALAGGARDLRLWSVETGRCLRTLEGEEEIKALAISPDGRYALIGGRGARLWEINCFATPYLAPMRLCRWQLGDALLSQAETYELELAQAEQARQNGDWSAARDCLRRARSLPSYHRDSRSVALWAELYTRLPRLSLKEVWETATLTGHSEGIQDIVFSSNGQWLLSGSSDSSLKLWNVDSGECHRTFSGYFQGSINSVAFSPDQTYLVSASSQGLLKLWETQTGKNVHTFRSETPNNHSFTSVCFSPDGRYLLVGSEGGESQIWEVSTGKLLRTLVHLKQSKFKVSARGIKAVCFSPDGRYALSGEADNGEQSEEMTDPFDLPEIKLWDVATGECIQTAKGHTGGIRALDFSPDGHYAVSASDDGSLKLWAIFVGRYLRTLEGHQGPVTSVSFSADGRFILSGSEDRTLKIWNATTGECLRTLEGHEGSINGVRFSSDSRYAVSGSSDGTGKLWFLDWELGDRPANDWDDSVRAYLENFLTLHTPYATALPVALRPKFLPPPSPAPSPPLGFIAFLFTIVWGVTAIATEIMAEDIRSIFLALGMIIFILSYFLGRQVGNQTVQLGSLFGTGVLAIVTAVHGQTTPVAIVSSLLGSACALVLSGLVLGMIVSQPASPLPGFQSTQKLKAELGTTLTLTLLLLAIMAGIGVEVAIGYLPVQWLGGGLALISLILIVWPWRNPTKTEQTRGRFTIIKELGQKLIRTVILASLIGLIVFKWFVPSRLNLTVSGICSNPLTTQRYFERGGDPNATVVWKQTKHPLLICALLANNLEVVQQAIAAGADINIVTSEGKTPLHLAAEQGLSEIAKQLLDAGANVNAQDHQKNTPLLNVKGLETAKVLVSYQADINAVSLKKKTPLHWAISSNQIELAKFLIEQGADINAQCSSCQATTPLHAALSKKSSDLVKLILSRPGVNVKAKDKKGLTPLQYAQQQKLVEEVKLLQNYQPSRGLLSKPNP